MYWTFYRKIYCRFCHLYVQNILFLGVRKGCPSIVSRIHTNLIYGVLGLFFMSWQLEKRILMRIFKGERLIISKWAKRFLTILLQNYLQTNFLQLLKISSKDGTHFFTKFIQKRERKSLSLDVASASLDNIEQNAQHPRSVIESTSVTMIFCLIVFIYFY